MNGMKKEKIWSIFQIIALCVQTIAEIFAVVSVLLLDILLPEYVAILVLVMLILTIYSTLFMFTKVRGKIRLWRRIVSLLLALVIICGCVLVSKVALDTRNMIHNLTGNGDVDSRSSYVLVLDNDEAKKLADAKGYTFGAVEGYDVEHTEQLIAVIEEKTGETIEIKYYDQAMQMVDALYAGEINAVIMNSASISLLIEQEDYDDFLVRVRILYTHAFEDDSAQKPTKDENEISQKPFIVYISGSDTRSSKLTTSLSDVNILAVVNPQNKQILLVNTPRDYYVENPAGKGALDKLTHCGNYGVECSMGALENLYDIEIDYYGRINFAGFQKLIDAIDGVTIYSDVSFLANGRTYITKGENKLYGQGALDFSRERYNLSGGDNSRGKNQMKMIKAVIDKLTSSKTLISKYADILESLEGMIDTSFRAEEINNLVKMQLSDMTAWDIRSFAVTGTGGREETYSWKGQALYVMWPNEDTVTYASQLIDRVLDGEVLTEEDTKMPTK